MSATRLNYWKLSWPLDEARCPCDVHFFAYCRDSGVRGKSIFHFGTGEHHYLGLKNAELDPPNEVFAVTASKEEHDAYVRIIIDNPAIANHYKVLFCDIYTLTPRSVPRFDLVTLFHLGEFYSEANRAYTRGDDASVLRMFLDALNPGGELLLYRRSRGYPAARAMIDRLIDAGEVIKRADFETITSFGRREPS